MVERNIMSYGLLIGRYYQDYVLILNEYRGGVTTQRHINQAERGVTMPTYRVPVVDVDDDHSDNIQYLRNQLQAAIDNAIRQYRQRGGADHMDMPYWIESPIKVRHDVLCNYITNVVGVEPVVENLEEIIARVNHSRNVKWAAYADPKAVAQRERSAARKLAKQLLLGADA